MMADENVKNRMDVCSNVLDPYDCGVHDHCHIRVT